MPKRRIKKEDLNALPTTSPEEDLTPTPKATLEGVTPPADKEAQWGGIETETARVKDAFLTGAMTLNEAIDDLTTSLGTLKTTPEAGLPGLGERPEMRFPEEQVPVA